MSIVMDLLVAEAATWERLVILAPVFVIALGVTAAIFVLLGRGLAQSIRESGHPRLIIGGLLALAGVIVLLTYLGVELPREGG